MAAVLVHIDLDGDRPHAASLGALAAGRALASSWGATLYAGVIARGSRARRSSRAASPAPTARTMAGIDAIVPELAASGADRVVVSLTEGPVTQLWGSIGAAWQRMVDQLRPRLVLFGADAPAAAELAPRTGARLGARLLGRARIVDGDEVELRDRDGGYVRASDGGAVVVMIGGGTTPTLRDGHDDIDVMLLEGASPADPRIELEGTARPAHTQSAGVLVAIGDDVAGDARAVEHARALARLLGGHLIAGTGARGAVPRGAVVAAHTAVAPALLVSVGSPSLDVGGATSLVQLGASAHRTADAALAGPPDQRLAELVKRLEEA